MQKKIKLNQQEWKSNTKTKTQIEINEPHCILNE